jgi:peptidoglycan/xylan/chitin deacetylase (PgdA/CDA1 family)
MARFTILMYHQVAVPGSEAEAKYACPPARFARHMRYLRDRRPVVSLTAVRRHLAGEGALPDGAVVVTFDDGFRNNYTDALPILRRYEIPATLFFTAGLAGETNRWMAGGDFPERPMVTWDEVREMAGAGVEIGAHTLTHPRLTDLSAAEAAAEVAGARQLIEAKIEAPVASFAYPYGLFDDSVAEAVAAAGYHLACTTRPGFNRPGIDPLRLRRIEVFGTDVVWRLAQKIRFGCNRSGVTRPLRYYWGRLRARV